ncbi:MAG: hypothetical protein JWM74_4086 [Myxococcaceae bacterium]|nr:hypothetical protein [Myxococcaceae bacterium]
MTALAQEKSRRQFPWKYKAFTLASGTKAFKGGRAALNSSGQVVPITAAPGLLVIGSFAETVDATAGALPVQVEFPVEIWLEYLVNGTAGDAIAATDVGSICYSLDDQTVSISPGTGRTIAGRIWDVDAVKGIGVELLNTAREVGALPALPAYVANDSIPTSIQHNATYDVPTTAAASTITLPVAAPDGTRAFFSADGTKNAHTVQYRDATGAVVLTTALTASKRHLVVAVKAGGKWTANAYVSP